MAIFDSLKQSLRQWLLIDEKIHSTNNNDITRMTIYDEYALYDAWAISDSNILKNTYHNLPSSFDNHFWKSVPPKPRPTKTAGLASIILNTLINIVYDNYNGIKINNDDISELWNEIAKENNFDKVLVKAVRDALVFGEGAFKIMYLDDLCKYPIVSFVGAKKCNIKMVYGRVKEIEFFDNVFYDEKGKMYTLHEIYKRGSIEYKLYNDQEKEVSMSMLKETESLENVYFTDNDFLAALPFHIFTSDKYENHGESIFANGKTDLLDMLDETLSQYNLTVRFSDPKMYINDTLIPIKDGKRDFRDPQYNMLYIKTTSTMLETDDKIQVIQNAINSEAYGDTISQLIVLICAGLISPSTICIQLNSKSLIHSDSGESQREQEKQTLYTYTKIRTAICEAIPELINRVINMYNMLYNKKYTVSKEDISIEFLDYSAPDINSQLATFKAALPECTIISLEQYINRLYGDTMTEKEKAEELRRLYIINYGVENIEELLNKKTNDIINLDKKQEVEDAE